MQDERMLTDNEIIKAYINCIGVYQATDCQECPYHHEEDGCYEKMTDDILSLIIRQQAKIEMLDGYVEAMKKTMWPTVAEVVDGQIADAMEFARAEAIKEVIAIMKPWYRLLCVDEGDWCEQLDALEHNLVKEMVGDPNENL